MPIWIDYREKAILRLCPEGKEATPPVGDIWIGDMSGNDLLTGIILERKTGADLEASIMDGRYSEQRGRLLAYAREHKVAIGYIIEGIIDRIDGRLGESALLKHMMRLQIHHRIPVIQSSCPEETVKLSRLIEEQWVKDRTQFCWSSECATTTPVAMSYVKSACRDSPEAFLVGVMTQCRGVSEEIARLIAQKFPSLERLMGASEADLAALEKAGNPKRKVGPAVAKRLYGLLHTSAATSAGAS